MSMSVALSYLAQAALSWHAYWPLASVYGAVLFALPTTMVHGHVRAGIIAVLQVAAQQSQTGAVLVLPRAAYSIGAVLISLWTLARGRGAPALVLRITFAAVLSSSVFVVRMEYPDGVTWVVVLRAICIGLAVLLCPSHFHFKQAYVLCAWIPISVPLALSAVPIQLITMHAIYDWARPPPPGMDPPASCALPERVVSPEPPVERGPFSSSTTLPVTLRDLLSR
jgi:hypothetical protein